MNAQKNENVQHHYNHISVWRLKFDVWNFTRICHEENKNLSKEWKCVKAIWKYYDHQTNKIKKLNILLQVMKFHQDTDEEK